MSLTKPATWIVGTAVLAALVLVGAWVLVLGPQRTAAADLLAQTAAQESVNAQSAAHTTQLEQQFADLPTYEAQLALIKTSVPESAALPALVRDLRGLATSSGVSLDSLTPGPPAAPPTSTAEPTAPPVGAGGTTPGGLVQIPVALVVTGDFAKTELFVHGVQRTMKRTFLVTDVSVGPSGAAGSGTVTLTLSGDVFALPGATSTSSPTAP